MRQIIIYQDRNGILTIRRRVCMDFLRERIYQQSLYATFPRVGLHIQAIPPRVGLHTQAIPPRVGWHIQATPKNWKECHSSHQKSGLHGFSLGFPLGFALRKSLGKPMQPFLLMGRILHAPPITL